MEKAVTSADVYRLCHSHDELLRHSKLPIVRRTCAALRSFKRDRTNIYVTPADAFDAHRQFVLLNAEFDKPKRARRGIELAVAIPDSTTPTPAVALSAPPQFIDPALVTPTLPTLTPPALDSQSTLLAPATTSAVVGSHDDDNQCLLCYSAPATVRLLPCQHDAFCAICWSRESEKRVKAYRKRRIRFPNLEEEALLIPCPVCRNSTMSCEDKDGVAVLQRRIDVLETTVSQMRGSISRQNTASRLECKLFSRNVLPRLRVIPIVGDGRCLFYSLLHSRSAVPPLPWEADELRAQLRVQLDTMTEDAWERRVPQHARDIITRAEFADKYLNPNRPTAHVPIDCIALWQDLTPDAPDVYVLTQVWVHEKNKLQPVKQEHVEVMRATTRPAKSWMLLQLTWHGGGHFQLITLDNIIVHSRTLQPVVDELDELVEGTMQDILGRKEARRNDVRAGRTTGRKMDEQVVVE